MRRIVLKKLKIENFKGCKERQIDFGQTTDIFGANASGKTTIFDAFTWLLFDRDSTGSTKFNIRPLDADGKMIDNVEILVEAVLDVDGEEITLQKVQKQIWTKKRGSDTVTFQGNANAYEINGFPQSEAEFKAKVADIIQESLFKLLTDPRAFAALPWKEQREILLKFISEITDADVLATDPAKYAPIADEVQAVPIEKCIEKAKKAMSKLKDRQKELPARIDEASKALVEVPELSDLELQRNALEEQLIEIQKQREDAGEAYKVVGELKMEIAKTRDAIGDAQRKANDRLNERRREMQQIHDELERKGSDLFDGRIKMESERGRLLVLVNELETERSALGEKWKAAVAMEMDESETVCQMCGQELPADKVEKIRTEFEQRKTDLINKTVARGNEVRAEIDSTKERITQMDADIAEMKQQWGDVVAEKNRAHEELNAIPTSADMSEDQEYTALQDKLATLQAQLAGMDTGESIKQQLATKEAAVRVQLDGVNRQFAAVETNDRAQERIEELKTEQRDVGQQVADQERKIYLLEEFSRAKMEMLSSRINGQFHLVNFKLFEMQINGGMKDTCEMTVNGVPYSSLNSAGKLQAGLDVIAALSRLYDVSAPIWIDNRESVTEIPAVDAQAINLYVSASDKALRIEVA